jgi:heptosyltransferase-1
MNVKSPRRVLIIRLSAIGDVVFASPLVAACKRTYPDAEIDWLAEGVTRPLLAGMPDINTVILWPRQEWVDLWRDKRLVALVQAVLLFRAQLRAKKYDLVVDAQGLLKSAFLAWLSGGDERVGFKSKEPNRLFLTRRLQKSITDRISSEYLGLAEDLGWDTRDFDLSLRLLSSDVERAGVVAGSESYLVVAPFTTRPQKHWTREHWQDLISALVAQGRKVACLGGPSDREDAQAMLGDLRVENWVGVYPLGVSAALIQGADAVIGVDTGLTHMGIAAGVPTVALFGSTCPYTQTGRDNVRVIYHALPCSPCKRRPTCGGHFDCMGGIRPVEVLDALRQVMPLKSSRVDSATNSEEALDE